MTTAETIREHLAIETEGSISPRVEPTIPLQFTQEELFTVLDAMRWQQVSIAKRPPSIQTAALSAMRKVNAAMVRQ